MPETHTVKSRNRKLSKRWAETYLRKKGYPFSKKYSRSELSMYVSQELTKQLKGIVRDEHIGALYEKYGDASGVKVVLNTNTVVLPQAAHIAKVKKHPKKKKATKKKKHYVDYKTFNAFYSLKPWRQLRYKALLKYGAKCMLCGASKEDGKIMHVDHIKPRYKYPELELKLSNLQILCEDCNMGKGGWDETDHR